MNAERVAEFFLALAEEGEEMLSNLKLQKLCYYAQGFHLAMYGAPLFPDPIEAWQHGPVVPELWRKYKDYGGQGIPPPQDADFSDFSDEVRELLLEVYDVYGQFSAWKLRNMTHYEMPWVEAWAKNGSARGDSPISQETMKRYFVTLVDEDE
jgi:uncharacterized phage-associated protein